MIAYILLRTSNRPNFFKNCMDSIRFQDYPNIIVITHTDNDNDTYATGDIIIKSEPQPTAGRGYYNLYNNALLQAIPDDKPGYYFFIDDDDMYYDSTVISKAIKAAKKNMVNVARVQRWNDTIWPKTWGTQKSYQTECFYVHTDHKLKATWWAKTGGDHFYSKQLTNILPINWVENLIICKAQEGKGNGKRYDIGERPPKEEKHLPRSGKVCYEDVNIIYLKEIKSPRSLRGKIGEVKKMQRMRAERLELKGKIKILNSEEVLNV